MYTYRSTRIGPGVKQMGALKYAPAITGPIEGGSIENRPANQAVHYLIRARP